MKFAEKIYPDKVILTLLFVFFLLSQTFVFIKNVVPLLVQYNPYAVLKYEERKNRWRLFTHENLRYFYDLKTKKLYPLPLLKNEPYRFKPALKGEYLVNFEGVKYRIKPFKELFPKKLFIASFKNVKLLLFWVFGFLIMYLFTRINYKAFRNKKFVYVLVSVSLLLLVLVLVKKFLNPNSHMPTRWLFGTSFQPSEFSKIVLILFLAYYIGVKGEIEKISNFFFALGVLVIHASLVALQTDLGMAIFYIVLGSSLMFVGGTPWRILIPSSFILGLAGVFFISANMETVKKRFSGWLDPFADPYDRGYQIIKSLEAVINGGFLGQGLGKGLYAAVYIRESDTDYVISLIVENLGVIGFFFILSLQFLFALRLFKYAVRIYGMYEKIIILGVALNFLYSVFVNYAMALNILPPKGIALPFISYGVSNLLSNMIMLGIVGSIYRRNSDVLNL
ncbi:FtsW/RodA/SpoVE family cell cycle protein [Aquifex aeolicus]|uniref:Probable peptidoglycan glycosyltransferase FtsW n=1 Tax=Aquifex aeolicus (strain VF5) TaxID=224324 RepID=O67212_AQUAE|nr:FtsW/RodA/SpoVE family cell cycle protein [Aquifex aeolicus]AAC07172.1 cell division protein FtsW [Aquifex aeolicus VF5]